MYKYAEMFRLWNLSGILRRRPPISGVQIAEAATIIYDDALLTIAEEQPDEERFVALGMGSLGRILVFCTPFGAIEPESSRRARLQRTERRQYEARK